MDLSYNETQGMLRETLARFLADTYDFESRKKMLKSPEGRDPGIWKAIATELGLTCAPFAEEHGGMGGGAIENMIMMEEFGKVIAIEPWLQTVVIGGGALKHAGGPLAEATIPAIIGGDAIIAFAYAEPQGRYNLADIGTTAKADGAGYVLNGHKGVVYAAPWATHLLVTARTGGSRRDRGGVELFLIEANRPGITRRDYPTVDGFMASEVYFENVAIPGEALLTGNFEGLQPQGQPTLSWRWQGRAQQHTLNAGSADPFDAAAVGTVIGQHHGAVRSGQDLREVQHHHAVEHATELRLVGRGIGVHLVEFGGVRTEARRHHGGHADAEHHGHQHHHGRQHQHRGAARDRRGDQRRPAGAGVQLPQPVAGARLYAIRAQRR